MQQGLQRVGVLFSGQTSEYSSVRRSPDFGRSLQFGLDPRGDSVECLSRKLRLIFRRHVTLIDHVEGLMPALRIRSVHQVTIQIVEPNIAFFSFGAMTPHTETSQHRANFFLKRRRSTECGRTERHEEQAYSNRKYATHEETSEIEAVRFQSDQTGSSEPIETETLLESDRKERLWSASVLPFSSVSYKSAIQNQTWALRTLKRLVRHISTG
jgi:hypothetical protein